MDHAVLAVTSDSRLKQDIRFTRTLDNGIQLYTFRYWNDARTFEGVMAQDLIADERFKHAVHVSPKGYYTVDLSALGLEMTGDAGQYMEASRKALEAKPAPGRIQQRNNDLPVGGQAGAALQCCVPPQVRRDYALLRHQKGGLYVLPSDGNTELTMAGESSLTETVASCVDHRRRQIECS